MAYYKFENHWTKKSRMMIDEHNEITEMRVMDTEVIDDSDILIISSTNTNIIYQDAQSHSVESSLELVEEMNNLTDKLHNNNIYMNESIMSMISKYESVLEDKSKSFNESVAIIYYNIREAENKYTQVLNENINLFFENPTRAIPVKIINHFESRYAN